MKVPTEGAGLEQPASPPIVSSDEERISVASQWQLMWWRFRNHKLAVVGGVIVLLFYVFAIFADFLAYSNPETSDAFQSLMRPQPIHWLDEGIHPYVHPVEGTRTFETNFNRVYVADESTKIRVCFFCRGFEYKFLGLIRSDIHLIGVEGASAESSLFLLGTDKQGRDVFSRLVYATRTSLTIGLLGVVLSLVLGVALGAISGFYGGPVDSAIQRLIEILSSIPVIPLWMGLAAAMPEDWSVYQVYFALTVIISLIGWTGLAREVRGRFLSLRDEDFVMAAELAGCGSRRIIFVHIAPSITSHVIATATLSLPFMILAETALSFIGLGLRAPAVSWGVMLEQAQNIQTIALSPWLMLPVVPLIALVLSFNFLGDGLRDAADPYGV
jgi:peptide/nickel transport system permease protein